MDEFHKNQAKFEQEKYWTVLFLELILPAFIIALWLLFSRVSIGSKMIWPGGVSIRPILVFERFHRTATNSNYEFGCLSAELGEAPPHL